MKFTLTIELGNELMQTYPDVIGELQTSFNKMVAFGEYNDCQIEADETGIIRDLNGNVVGKWEVTA